jgi:hypothetical protein
MDREYRLEKLALGCWPISTCTTTAFWELWSPRPRTIRGFDEVADVPELCLILVGRGEICVWTLPFSGDPRELDQQSRNRRAWLRLAKVL